MAEKQLVVNFFGSPCTGKSTLSAWLFSELKTRGIKCEYVTEFAKDLTWENNTQALMWQQYVFGQQSYNMFRVKDKVDVIITDSPLPLTIIYNKQIMLEPEFSHLVLKDFCEYDNLNIRLEVIDDYSDIGRNQTKEEAKQISKEIEQLLANNNIPATTMKITDKNVREKILQMVLDKLEVKFIKQKLK